MWWKDLVKKNPCLFVARRVSLGVCTLPALRREKKSSKIVPMLLSCGVFLDDGATAALVRDEYTLALASVRKTHYSYSLV